MADPELETPKEIYASELLDTEGCAACRAVDGKRYASLELAAEDYPNLGGYRLCTAPEGCRGTIVLVGDEAPPTIDDRPGAPVSAALTQLQRAKAARIVRGKDMFDWYDPCRALLKAKQWDTLDPLLTELMAASELYDDLAWLPPQAGFHEMACTSYQRRHWYTVAASCLERWLALPDVDKVPGRARRITERLNRIRAR